MTSHDKQCLAEFSSFLRMDGEAAKLADILSGMTEGGGHYDHPSELYAPDFSPSDGDVYVQRAADLLREQAAEIARLLDLSMKATQPSQAALSDAEIYSAWHAHWSNASVPSTACSAFYAGVRYAVAAINAKESAS